MSRRSSPLAHGATLLVLGAVLLSACESSAVDVKRDPSFTREEMRAGGLLVGGVASALSDLSAEEGTRYAALLEEEIASAWTEDDAVTASEAALRLRPVGDACLAELGARGELSAERLAALGEGNSDSRYLLLASIYGDELDYDEFVSEAQEVSGLEALVNRNRAQQEDMLVTKTIRSVKVAFLIYDLRSGGTVMAARIATADSTANREPLNVVSEAARGLYDTFDAFGFEGEGERKVVGEPPPPPAREQLLRKAFAEFAAELP